MRIGEVGLLHQDLVLEQPERRGGVLVEDRLVVGDQVLVLGLVTLSAPADVVVRGPVLLEDLLEHRLG